MGLLPHYGFANTELQWVRNYFDGRQQIVTVDGRDSGIADIEYGVIQGGTLAAQFFLIFIDQLCKMNLKGRLYLFADDTAILCEGESLEEVFESANADLNATFRWLCEHSLSLNIKKTNYLVFSNSPSKINIDHKLIIHSCGNYPVLPCSCPPLERVQFTRYLGVVVDDDLNWKAHISHLKLGNLYTFFTDCGTAYPLNH